MREPCTVCGGNDVHPVLDGVDLLFPTPGTFHVVGCQRCGFLWQDPPPDAATLARAYPPDYHQATGPGGRLQAWFQRRLNDRRAADVLARIGGRGAVLEVGCGDGSGLAPLLGRPGVVAKGLEPHPEAAARARALGIQVFETPFEALGGIPDRFDAVILKHVLEHLPAPRTRIREIARILRPGGIVILEVPNAASLERRVLGRYWLGYDLPRHLYSFSVETLRRLLVSEGFSEVETSHSLVPNSWAMGLEAWLKGRGLPARAARAFGMSNPLVMAAAVPISLLAAVARCAGRIRVVARKADATR